MGVNAGCPISANIAHYCLGLALDNGVISGGYGQPFKISKALKDRPHKVWTPRQGSFRRGFVGLRQSRLTAKQLQKGLDDCLPSALAAQAAAINLGSNGNQVRFSSWHEGLRLFDWCWRRGIRPAA